MSSYQYIYYYFEMEDIEQMTEQTTGQQNGLGAENLNDIISREVTRQFKELKEVVDAKRKLDLVNIGDAIRSSVSDTDNYLNTRINIVAVAGIITAFTLLLVLRR
jgi:hypothetical protein